MKYLLIFILLLTYFSCFSQEDTVIHTDIYTSYFSTKFKEPLYVKYNLYKGGGVNSRKKDRFKDIGTLSEATNKDYAKTGYDEGHMANAEDFAYNAKYLEETFRFFNCLPQTARLNRGIWKVWETMIRKLSQIDSLTIYCGGIFEVNDKTIGNKVFVPDYCWKIVYDNTTKKNVYDLYFPNDNSDSVQVLTEGEIDSILKKHNINLNGK